MLSGDRLVTLWCHANTWTGYVLFHHNSVRPQSSYRYSNGWTMTFCRSSWPYYAYCQCLVLRHFYYTTKYYFSPSDLPNKSKWRKYSSKLLSCLKVILMNMASTQGILQCKGDDQFACVVSNSIGSDFIRGFTTLCCTLTHLSLVTAYGVASHSLHYFTNWLTICGCQLISSAHVGLSAEEWI